MHLARVRVRVRARVKVRVRFRVRGRGRGRGRGRVRVRVKSTQAGGLGEVLRAFLRDLNGGDREPSVQGGLTPLRVLG